MNLPKLEFEKDFTLSNQELFDAIQATIKNYRETSSQLSPLLTKHLEILLKIQQKRAEDGK